MCISISSQVPGFILITIPSQDADNKGFITLAELDKGIRHVLESEVHFEAKPAIMRAYHAARRARRKRRTPGDDTMDRGEFKLFLVALRRYFEYLVINSR